MRAEELDALRGEGFGDEDPHASTGASAPIDSSAARWAAATPRADLDRATVLERGFLDDADRVEDLAEGHRAEVADPEDVPGDLALAAGQDDAARLDRPVERLPVEPLGDPGGRDRPRGEALIGEQLEAERLETGPRGGRAGLVAGEDPGRRLALHELEALVDLVDDGERRRPRGLALGVRRPDGRAGRGRSAASSPSPSPPRPGPRRRPWPGPGALIQAFCDPVTTMSMPQASISNGTAPSAETLSTRMRALSSTSRIAAASTGIGFITPVEVSLWVSRTAL